MIMTTDFRVYLLIGLFIYICILMIFFNSVVTGKSKSKNVLLNQKIVKWRHLLRGQMLSSHNVKKHKRYLIKKLANSKNLIFYAIALKHFKEVVNSAYNEYLTQNHSAFRKLADIYLKKSEFEKACYLSFISDFPEIIKYNPQLLHTFTFYLKDVNEKNNLLSMNALRMVSNCGNTKAFINVLQIINDNDVFIHHHVLTTELSNFNGDKKELLTQLQKSNWSDKIENSIKIFNLYVQDGE